MKKLIILLIIFGSFQALSKDCDITNYRDFVFNDKEINKLIKRKKERLLFTNCFFNKC